MLNITYHVPSANRIRLWNKGVDSESFHTKYRRHEMRVRLRYHRLLQFLMTGVLRNFEWTNNFFPLPLVVVNQKSHW
jgi:hypothetical protein